MTNADKIRSMTDEELAKVIMCDCTMGSAECNSKSDCVECCLEWLQQPAED